MVRHSSHAALGFVVLVLAFGFAGCGKGHSNEKGKVTGTVAYQEGMTLPAEASVNVQLTDVSKEDASAPVVAETTLTTAGQQPPVPFELSYSSDTIDPQHKYAVRATIEADGKTLYRTETQYPVITGGNDNDVQIMLVSTGEMPDSSAGGTAALAGTEWQLADLGGNGIVADTKPTLKFSDDGKVSGDGTCNDFNGPVTMSASTISFGPLAATKKACADAAKNGQETKYLSALQDASTFTVEGTTLTIHTKGGGALQFTRTKPAP